MRMHMAAHRDAAGELQAAIADGRLVDARELATWFATHEMEVLPDWRPYLEDMRTAALQIAHAGDLSTAGRHIGKLGGACSACHVAQGARLAFAPAAPPHDDGTLESQMERHRWAAARLWEGLVGPADERWLEGARAMMTAPLDVAGSTHGKPNVEVVELGERLRDQARAAAELTSRSGRAQLYGEMMHTCASCHQIVRYAPVARKRSEP